MYAYKVSGSEYENGVPSEQISLMNSIRTTGVTGVTGIQELVEKPCGSLTVGEKTTEVVKGLWEQPEIVGGLSQLPRVVPFYGKSREDLEQVLGYVEKCNTDLGVHCLLNAHTTYTPKVYPYRGFTLVNGCQKVRQIEQCESLEHRPVWFLFSGMGIEQWSTGLVREMLKLDLFRRSIERSCEILKSCGVDLMQLINGDRVTFTGVESFVYLTAIQIALVDLLRQIGIKPEGMIGQSIGELVCGYVDQCLTHEQALMVSYYLGKWVQEAKTIPRSLMAVVGDLTWEQLKTRCPTGVVPVCFDSVNQILITGPVQQVRDLLTQLRLEGVFVKEIELPTSTVFNGENFGLIHTEYLTEILPVLRQYLQTLNILPRQRSTRWVSTCVPESNTQFLTFSVEYLMKMITSPVMLQHSLRQVPSNAILIEISPRSLVQDLLKRSFVQQQYQQSTFAPFTYGSGIVSQVVSPCVLPTIIPLMPTTYGIEGPTGLEHFLVQLGRLYLEGVEFDSVKLFVPVDMVRSTYPVPVGQEVVGLFSKWNLPLEPLSYFVQQQRQQQVVEDMILNSLSGLSIGGCGDVECVKFTVDVESLLEKESYLLNHQINGRVLYPTTGYLYLVWKSLAQMQRQQPKTTTTLTQPILLDSVFGQSYCIEQLPPVCFENVQIHRATVLREQPQQIVIVPQNRRVLFQINIQPTTGLFEIVEGKNVIVTGRVYIPCTGVTGVESFVTPFKTQWETQVRSTLVVPQEQVYEKFRQYGYEYNGEFQPIVRSNVSGTQGELLWTGKWIPFLDAMLQMNILAQQQFGGEQRQTILPTRIRSIKINPIEHLIRAEKYVTLPVVHDLYTNKTLCGCVEITGLQVTPVVLPRGQFYPTITGETTTTLTTFLPTTTSTTLNTVTGGESTLGKYYVVDGEQVPVVGGGQWYKTVFGGEQPQTRGVFGRLGQWTVEQPRQGKWTVLGGEQQLMGTFNPRLTHVIIGALDCEFGLELAQWMVQFGGVRYLVLSTQRVGGESTLTVQQIQQLRYLQTQFGCEIKIVSTLDLSDETECLLFVRQACRMSSHLEGRIGSVFHLGGLFVEQPTSVHIRSLYNLDKHTRCSTVMPDYGFFVVFGRTHLTGLVGLQNVIEGVCESRRRECGKHALVVEWSTLFGTVEQPTGIEYKQGLIKLGQLLVKSIRFQLPIEYQQQWGQFPVEQFVCGPCEQEQYVSTLPKRQWGITTGVQSVRPFYLPTKVVEQLNGIEYVYGQQQVTPLFVVLPFGVPIGQVKSWAQQLRVPVYGLHYTTECSRFETVEQLAQFYWQQIEKVFPQLEKFHLVGHTYGVPVAFEMASRRPQQVMSLVFLDSGLTKTFLNTWYGKETPMTVFGEIDALYQVYQLFVQGCSMGVEQFRTVLSQLPTFDERVKYVCGKIVEQVGGYTYDLVELEQLVRLFVQRVIMSSRYVPTQPLRLGNILVVRPTTVPSTTEYVYGQQGFEQELVEKILQGLKQFVFGKLQVCLVDGEQVNFLHGETGTRIASILNKHFC